MNKHAVDNRAMALKTAKGPQSPWYFKIERILVNQEQKIEPPFLRTLCKINAAF